MAKVGLVITEELMERARVRCQKVATLTNNCVIALAAKEQLGVRCAMVDGLHISLNNGRACVMPEEAQRLARAFDMWRVRGVAKPRPGVVMLEVPAKYAKK